MRTLTGNWRGVFCAVIAAGICGVHTVIASAATTVSAVSAVPAAAAPCQACHGAQGQGMVEGDRPRIAGANAGYLDKQLRDFASGSRESAIMGPLAKTLSDTDRISVVTYFSSLPMPPALASKTPTASEAALGHRLALEGSELQRVQACDNCHGPQGSGVAFSAPALAGQLAPYLTTQLKSWQQGTRRNDSGSVMSSVATRLSDTDIAAVTAYYAALGPAATGGK